MTFLESLVAEWYAYNGHFVQTNVKFGKRKAGGYEGEMDVLAFHPLRKVMTHVETSTDADSWEQRRQRFGKKFADAAKYYPELFQFDYQRVEKVAIVGLGRTVPTGTSFEHGVVIKTVPEFIFEVTEVLRWRNPAKEAVPEHWPLLRAIQMSVFWGSKGTTSVPK